MKRFLSAAVTLLATMAAAAPPPGTITIVGRQMGAPVEGQFRQFTAQVQFDPANPAAGKAAIEVETASIDVGLEDFNYELRSRTWFDAENHPKATFVSNAIKPLAADRFEVNGMLTIKGEARAVTVPVTFTRQAATQVFEGTLPIRRTDFNVGEGEWKSTDVVADEVQIRFRVMVPAT